MGTRTRSILTAMLLLAMLCSTMTACGKKAVSESTDSTAMETTTETSVTTTLPTDPPVLEEAVEANSGDAYLTIADGDWYAQYWGSDADLLSYDAGVVAITGDGAYTVSVNGASKGLRYDVTGDDNSDYVPTGISLLAVTVKDGAIMNPDMAITIQHIRVDGVELPMTAKNFTATSDGFDLRANMFTTWVTTIPEDAHDAEGIVTDAAAYGAQIVDPSDIGAWTRVEVDFTISGWSE
jgi:hypothetical protein